TGTFATGTGAVSLNGITTLATGKNLIFAGGASNFDQSASSGTFATGTGAVTLNGATTISGTNTLTVGTGLTTLGGGLTISAGSTFTNSSSTLDAALSVADHPTGGALGTAAATVDVATTFDIHQTT